MRVYHPGGGAVQKSMLQQDGGTGTGKTVYPQPVPVSCGDQVLLGRVPPTPGQVQLVRSGAEVSQSGGERAGSEKAAQGGKDERVLR